MKQRKRMNRLNKGKKKKMDSRWIKTNNIYLQMGKVGTFTPQKRNFFD